MNAEKFFVPSFLEAVKKNTEEGFRSIITESSPGVYTFDMLQPHFCEMLMSEVSSFVSGMLDLALPCGLIFEKWAVLDCSGGKF